MVEPKIAVVPRGSSAAPELLVAVARSVALGTVLTFALALACAAQSVVVPASAANARGTGSANTLVRDANNPRTYQMGLPAAALAGLPAGAVLTGISFRASITTANPTTWPATDLTFSDYEIRIGAAKALRQWTTTLADNFVGTPALARDGGMTIERGSFSASTLLPGVVPNPWGVFFFDFQDVVPFAGGDLAIEFAHPGSDGSGALFLDTIASNVATGIGYTATAFPATTGVATSFAIPRLHYGYGTTCPGTNDAKPVLNLTNDTVGGGAARVAVGNARPRAAMVYAFGSERRADALPGGCLLLTNLLVTVPATTDANGRHALALTVPVDVRGTAQIQALIVDAEAVGGFTASNGVSLTAR
jgi:hypothetical protein